MKTRYHAVMLDETRCEFGVSVEANSRSEAYDLLREDYPESQCVQLESPDDTANRERAMYDDISRGIYRNEDGSIEFQEPGYDDYDDDYEDEEEDDYEDEFDGMGNRTDGTGELV